MPELETFSVGQNPWFPNVSQFLDVLPSIAKSSRLGIDGPFTSKIETSRSIGLLEIVPAGGTPVPTIALNKEDKESP